MRSSSLPSAVSRMMGVALVARMRRHASMPSMPGSIRSSTMRSGRMRASASIAAKPSATRSTTNPAERRYSETTSADGRVVIHDEHPPIDEVLVAQRARWFRDHALRVRRNLGASAESWTPFVVRKTSHLGWTSCCCGTMIGRMDGQGLLAAGRSALAKGDWPAAMEAFQAAWDEQESADALDGVGLSLWWLGDAPAALDVRSRAFALLRREGRDARGGDGRHLAGAAVRRSVPPNGDGRRVGGPDAVPGCRHG